MDVLWALRTFKLLGLAFFVRCYVAFLISFRLRALKSPASEFVVGGDDHLGFRRSHFQSLHLLRPENPKPQQNGHLRE